MLETISPAPPDPILGLTEAFNADSHPDKINLGVGVYKDEQGQTPILNTVRTAETRLLEHATTKSYLPIPGAPAYARGVQALLFGEEHPLVEANRVRTAHTPGGTGGLRVGGEFLKRFRPDATLWVSSPTWANHKGVFTACGFAIKDYPYYDPASRGLDFDALCDTLRRVPPGDIVLLHVCCHNPTGADPSPEQWETLADLAAECGWFPFFDFAYQGFGTSIEADRKPLHVFAARDLEFAVAASCSKNFGLYSERTGSFSLAARTPEAAEAAFSHVKKTIRANYSNPPRHGGAIVETILDSPELKAAWIDELEGMRTRIHDLRSRFVSTLRDKGVERDFSFITRQNGMFSFSGLNPEQVEILRREHSIYIVGSGRINVAGISAANLDRLCGAIASVL